MGNLLSRWGFLAAKGGHLVSTTNPSGCTDCCTVYCAACGANTVTLPITVDLSGFAAGVGGGGIGNPVGCGANCTSYGGTFVLSNLPGSSGTHGAAPIVAICGTWDYHTGPMTCWATSEYAVLSLSATIYFNDTATATDAGFLGVSIPLPAGWSAISLRIQIGGEDPSGNPLGTSIVAYGYTQPGQFLCSFSYPLSYYGGVGLSGGNTPNEYCDMSGLTVQASM